MSRRKSIIGALAACALALAAFGAASASAANVSVYECQNVGAGKGAFSDSMCATGSPGGEFGTVKVTGTISPTATAVGNSTLTAKIGGVNFIIQCTAMMSNAGTATNGSGTATGAGIELDYTGCTVLNPEPTKCVIKNGTIATFPLSSSADMPNANESNVTFKPENAENIFTNITLEGCGTKAFNGTKSVTGSAVGVVSSTSPAQTVFSGTAGGKLIFGGQVAEFSSTNHATGPNGGTLALETP
jgi:hypothetical protein